MTDAHLSGFGFETLGVLLFVTVLVAMLCRRAGLPSSVGLVAAGAALALAAPGVAPPLTRELIFSVCLPPLVFEAAIHIPLGALRREAALLAALASAGVVIAAAVVAGGMHWLVGWSWTGAALFGVLIAATDPVSVIATFRAIAVPRRLHLLVEAESLLNDGTAAVGFALLVGIAAGGSADAVAVSRALVFAVGGGVLCGVAVAGALLWLARRSDDRLVELTLTWLIAYGAFLLAERLGGSGVLATLAAGLVVGRYGLGGRAISERGTTSVPLHWEFVAFLVNALVFVLIGSAGVGIATPAVAGAAVVAILLSLAGRAAAIYPLGALFARSRLALPRAYRHILVWGGLRGALALALALGLPRAVAERGEIVAVTFAVVAFSIVVQGLTVPRLIARLGLRQGTSTVSTGVDAVAG